MRYKHPLKFPKSALLKYSEMEKSTFEILRNLLTLKFKKEGEELIKEVESPEWSFLASINAQEFLQSLEENNLFDPDKSFPGSNTERVTVLVPFEGSQLSSRWVSWLKARLLSLAT